MSRSCLGAVVMAALAASMVVLPLVLPPLPRRHRCFSSSPSENNHSIVLFFPDSFSIWLPSLAVDHSPDGLAFSSPSPAVFAETRLFLVDDADRRILFSKISIHSRSSSRASPSTTVPTASRSRRRHWWSPPEPASSSPTTTIGESSSPNSRFVLDLLPQPRRRLQPRRPRVLVAVAGGRPRSRRCHRWSPPEPASSLRRRRKMRKGRESWRASSCRI